MNLSKYWKTVVAVLGVVGMFLTFVLDNFAGVLPAGWGAVITGVLGLLTAVGVYQAPYKGDAPKAGRRPVV